MLNALVAGPDEHLACVLFGSNDARNEQLFVAALRLPCSRLVVIGANEPYPARVKSWLDVTNGRGCEFWPSETAVPAGNNIIIFDGRNQ